MNGLPRVLLVASLALVGLAPAEPQEKRKGGGDLEEVDRRGAEGEVPLGASVKGMIVLGFYNTVSFEAVAGTTVTLGLRTFHDTATPLAELLDPRRGVAAAFEPMEDDPHHLRLEGFTLPETGTWTVRFGFQKEENGRFEMTTDATFPEGGVHSVTVPPGGEAALPIHGMLGRRLARCEFLLPEGTDVEVTLVHPRGEVEDLAKHTRRTTFQRRVKITDLPLDSNTPLELRFEDVGGEGATFDVELEFANPKLSRKRIRI